MASKNGRETFDFRKIKFVPYGEAKNLAIEICNSEAVTFERRKIVILVDMFGVYHRVMEWMSNNHVPVTTAELPSRIAGHLLWSAMEKVREREKIEFRAEGMDFDDLVGNLSVCHGDNERALPSRVNQIECRWEFFYAPSPVEKIIKQLAWRRRTQYTENLRNELLKGRVPTGYEVRDYSIYDDYIRELRNWLDAKLAEPGFYGVGVNNSTVSLSEKEVDIRITIRAMDITNGNESDAVCIVSSDQDYGPLHQRIQDAGLICYFADVAKFAMPTNVGKKIRDLESYIPVELSHEFFLGLIQEYVGIPQMLKLSDAQYGALCQAYRDHGGTHQI